MTAHLNDGLRPIYLLTGDEPFQIMEAADQLRRAASEAGYTDRSVVYVDASTDWNSVFAGCANISLFGDQSLLEIRFGQSKVSKGAAEAILEYLQKGDLQTLVVLQTGKLDKKALATPWVQAVQQHGVLMRVWPLQGRQLIGWIEQRMKNLQVQAAADTAGLIASRTEGNLLAAAQEIEKMSLLQLEPNALDPSDIMGQQQSVYSIYDLVDALLKRQMQQSLIILQQLRAEATAATLVVWALSELVRALLMAGPYSGTRSQNAFFFSKRDGIARWNQRSRGVNITRLLVRCAYVDRVIKGRAAGDAWNELSRICVRLCA